MISNLPDWITAGTAVTAVVGGLFGVYTTTQSRIDVTEERIQNTLQIIHKIAANQEDLTSSTAEINYRLTRSEVSAEYLKEGQDRLMAEVKMLSQDIKTILKEE